MKAITIRIACAVMFLTQVVHAQKASSLNYGLGVGEVPATEIPVSLQVFHVNAPPAQCGCFWMYGGGAGMVLNFTRHWSGVVDLLGAHANNINGSDEHLGIFNYQVGPRYSFRRRSSWTPYAQALVGGSDAFSNYAIYGQGKNSFSSTVGGGVTKRLSDRIAVTVAEGSWMFSEASNGLNNRQNNIRLTTGIVFRLLPR